MTRTLIGETQKKIGEKVTIKGWVHARRNMGKLVFLDMRDRSGILQVVCVPKMLPEDSVARLADVRTEWVLEIIGTVQARQEKDVNTDMQTGAVELLAENLIVLNESLTTPFEVAKDTSVVSEELRLKYRYLDLRTERMQRNIRLRHQMQSFCREWLAKQGFVEIETPTLTAGTPEGAREFIVPSRTFTGSFYALPQSPQQFKQLLMVAGFERYFQFARCWRDEDQRGDRQPEFTQLDMELSFVEQEDVIALNEALLIELVQTLMPKKRIQQIPFPRLKYQDVMKQYGTDRPDIREDKSDPNLLAFCWVVDFPFFEKTDEGGSGGGETQWTFTHNPFSAPLPEHRSSLMNKQSIESILTTQYDVVLNGLEIGGGSIRNHHPEALQKVFEIMGIDEETMQRKFSHMFEAFQYGAPPHGGIAWGFDRLVSILANEPNIREIIPFPKTSDARDPMMHAPAPVAQKQLDELNLQVKK